MHILCHIILIWIIYIDIPIQIYVYIYIYICIHICIDPSGSKPNFIVVRNQTWFETKRYSSWRNRPTARGATIHHTQARLFFCFRKRRLVAHSSVVPQLAFDSAIVFSCNTCIIATSHEPNNKTIKQLNNKTIKYLNN